MKQRPQEERIAELEAKIAAIKTRDEKKRAKANPAVRHAMLAVKAIDKASAATTDTAARTALGGARGEISAWLALEGLAVNGAATSAPVAPTPKRKREAATA